jgi:hypothetical protein
MTDDDFSAASMALVNWLCSQNIHPEDAVRVLTTTLIGTLRMVAEHRGLAAKEGAQIVISIIEEATS